MARIHIECERPTQKRHFFSNLNFAAEATSDETIPLTQSKPPLRNGAIRGLLSELPRTFCFCGCGILAIGIIVFLTLFYLQTREAVEKIDGAVSLQSKAINIIKNVDPILNTTAGFAASAGSMMQSSTQKLDSMLDEVSKIVANPVITVG